MNFFNWFLFLLPMTCGSFLVEEIHFLKVPLTALVVTRPSGSHHGLPLSSWLPSSSLFLSFPSGVSERDAREGVSEVMRMLLEAKGLSHHAERISYWGRRVAARLPSVVSASVANSLGLPQREDYEMWCVHGLDGDLFLPHGIVAYAAWKESNCSHNSTRVMGGEGEGLWSSSVFPMPKTNLAPPPPQPQPRAGFGLAGASFTASVVAGGGLHQRARLEWRLGVEKTLPGAERAKPLIEFLVLQLLPAEAYVDIDELRHRHDFRVELCGFNNSDTKLDLGATVTSLSSEPPVKTPLSPQLAAEGGAGATQQEILQSCAGLAEPQQQQEEEQQQQQQQQRVRVWCASTAEALDGSVGVIDVEKPASASPQHAVALAFQPNLPFPMRSDALSLSLELLFHVRYPRTSAEPHPSPLQSASTDAQAAAFIPPAFLFARHRDDGNKENAENCSRSGGPRGHEQTCGSDAWNLVHVLRKHTKYGAAREHTPLGCRNKDGTAESLPSQSILFDESAGATKSKTGIETECVDTHLTESEKFPVNALLFQPPTPLALQFPQGNVYPTAIIVLGAVLSQFLAVLLLSVELYRRGP